LLAIRQWTFRRGTLNNILKQAGAQMKYLIVYEKSDTGWGAYAPDLPGLGAAGKTLDEVKELIREAVEFHLEGMREHGDPIPPQSAITEYISV
jgi:predicted RNase H-like HicB family nuclease